MLAKQLRILRLLVDIFLILRIIHLQKLKIFLKDSRIISFYVVLAILSFKRTKFRTTNLVKIVDT